MPPVPSPSRPSLLRRACGRACGGACLLRLGICALVLLSVATLLEFTPQSLAPARLGTDIVRAYNTAVRKLEHSSHFPLGSLRQIQRQGSGSAARSSPASLVRRMAPYVREWSRLAANGNSGSSGSAGVGEETVVLIWETMRTLHPMPPSVNGDVAFDERLPCSTPCRFTRNRAKLAEAHAIIFSDPFMAPKDLPPRRSRGTSTDAAAQQAEAQQAGASGLRLTGHRTGGAVADTPHAAMPTSAPPTTTGEGSRRRVQPWILSSHENHLSGDYLQLMAAMRKFQVLVGYNMDAHVPVWYGTNDDEGAGGGKWMDNLPMLTPPHKKRKDGSLLAAWVSNCHARNSYPDRVGLLEQLSKKKRGLQVHSYGRCLQNKQMPIADAWHNVASKRSVAATYKFTAAFENSMAVDYVTEKVYDALHAGSVPVYLGAPNIREYVPVGSIIDVKDYVDEGTGKVDVDALAKYLRYLAGNDTAYAEYTRWRDEPLPANIATLQKLGRDSAPCRICHCLRGRLGCDDVL